MHKKFNLTFLQHNRVQFVIWSFVTLLDIY